MNRSIPKFALLVAILALASWVGLAPTGSRPAELREAALRWLFVGAPLMEVQVPADDLETPLGAVEVLVAFVGGARVAVETFQCLLNDQDVTSSLTLGRNGAGGSLVGLHDGENQIVLRVFGKSWWGGSGFVEEQRARIVRVRPIPFLDVA
jgi:hypothetical protein